ncbi:MAG: cyanophycin synthetase, partial [Planctomycetota bacterium]
MFVDYAHTPAALSHAVATLREHLDGRLIVVCGAGGDRDPSKRPGLGQAASAADLVVVTSDNPRTEAPEAIIRDVAAGIGGGAEILTLVDRAAAIDAAV